MVLLEKYSGNKDKITDFSKMTSDEIGRAHV